MWDIPSKFALRSQFKQQNFKQPVLFLALETGWHWPVTNWKGRVEISWPDPATPMIQETPQPLCAASNAWRITLTLPKINFIRGIKRLHDYRYTQRYNQIHHQIYRQDIAEKGHPEEPRSGWQSLLHQTSPLRNKWKSGMRA